MNPLTFQPGLWYDRGMLAIRYIQLKDDDLSPHGSAHLCRTASNVGAFSVFREAI